MNFNKHFDVEGQHAFLSASKYHWVNYDEEKLAVAFTKFQATQLGTRLHEFACECIRLGVKLPKTKKTLNMYVNDAIGFKMEPEQTLYYSENCFGTTDAIAFRQNFLRIHDLKTGATPSSIRQLEIYTALFCLEYNFSPKSIGMELRLYQSDEVIVHEPVPEDILYIMDKIVIFDKQIDKMKMGE
ncbi:MAG: hypothetical protein N2317_08660 [Syntrophales bacterium]|nr:hypothetical protein [Syntrophales bacterium]